MSQKQRFEKTTAALVGPLALGTRVMVKSVTLYTATYVPKYVAEMIGSVYAVAGVEYIDDKSRPDITYLYKLNSIGWCFVDYDLETINE